MNCCAGDADRGDGCVIEAGSLDKKALASGRHRLAPIRVKQQGVGAADGPGYTLEWRLAVNFAVRYCYWRQVARLASLGSRPSAAALTSPRGLGLLLGSTLRDPESDPTESRRFLRQPSDLPSSSLYGAYTSESTAAARHFYPRHTQQPPTYKMGGANREGKSSGKVKPLKAAKKEKKDLDEDDLAYLEKKRADEKARAEMAKNAKGKGPLNTGTQGIKKSGKK
ncbi:uncharacterized protein JN550_003452 [Neoarthrinium moseri]|uniref:uncharacterized protein n=1 Tax=Neoarthrinium moseri TaxID=1658444 RepID=UPI001FDE5D57|nr:uncharacterized protein JN550_003452 [Neoarthrinium moseri]KAI1873199.1 hypothetical protein JN550_003452 [Neoarthrinium moseri]